MALLDIKRQKEIDKIINNIRKRYGTCPDKSIIQIVHDSGLQIYLHDFGKYAGDIRGSIDFEERAIYINKDMPEKNRTFTIAHEFGHYMLDGHHDKNVRYRIDFHSDLFPSDPVTNLQEIEANYFAGEILMPEEKIKKELNYNLKDVTDRQIEQLATTFNVSELALRVRISWIIKNPKQTT